MATNNVDGVIKLAASGTSRSVHRQDRGKVKLSRTRTFVAALFVSICTVWVSLCAVAYADVGGQQISPGQCPYPAVGPFGYDGIAQHYVCDFPTEINGSHHRCVFGGAAVTVVGGVSVLIFNASAFTYAGVLEGQCYWACPDGSMAEEPNPVMTWQGSSASTTPVVRSKCQPIGPNPFANRAPAQPRTPAQPASEPRPAPEVTPGQSDSGPAAPVQLVP